MFNSLYESLHKIRKYQEFEAENEINIEFICTICKKILIEPYSGPCGCRYCYNCIKDCVERNVDFCPGQQVYCCNEKLSLNENIKFDQSTDRRLSIVKVKCPEACCDYQTELLNIENHLRVCKFQNVQCPFVNIGCKEQNVASDKLDEHLVSENYSHFKLLMTFIDNIQNEVETLKCIAVELKSENQFLKEEIKEIKETRKLVENPEITDSNQKEKSAVFDSENANEEATFREKFLSELLEIKGQSIKEKKQLIQKTDNIQKFFESKMNKITEKNVHLTIQLQNNTDAIIYLERKCLNIDESIEKLNYGEFVWNIKNFSDLRKDAVNGTNETVFSDPFYSHKNGYKVCFGLSPNGFNIAQGSHLSIWFRILKGPFDNSLSWPFKYNVTFSIVNQDTGLIKTNYTLTYESYPNHIGWNKPTMNSKNQIIIYRFLKLEDLANNSPSVRGNEIIIKCKVHIPF